MKGVCTGEGRQEAQKPLKKFKMGKGIGRKDTEVERWGI